MKNSEQRATRVVVVVLIITGIAATAMAVRQTLNEFARVTAGSTQPVLGPVLGEVPPFALTRQDGQGFSQADLIGKVWIADFIFTTSAGPCPLMTQRMENLNNRFRQDQDLRLVSFSVDPEYDTPEVLTEYATHFGAQPERWAFLTGDRDAIYDLSIKGFKLAVDDQVDPGDYDHMIIHSTYFVLVDRAARIRGYYDGTDPERLAQLANDTTMLLREAAQ